MQVKRNLSCFLVRVKGIKKSSKNLLSFYQFWLEKILARINSD